jgi:hypothetical protein
MDPLGNITHSARDSMSSQIPCLGAKMAHIKSLTAGQPAARPHSSYYTHSLTSNMHIAFALLAVGLAEAQTPGRCCCSEVSRTLSIKGKMAMRLSPPTFCVVGVRMPLFPLQQQLIDPTSAGLMIQMDAGIVSHVRELAGTITLLLSRIFARNGGI